MDSPDSIILALLTACEQAKIQAYDPQDPSDHFPKMLLPPASTSIFGVYLAANSKTRQTLSQVCFIDNIDILY